MGLAFTVCHRKEPLGRPTGRQEDVVEGEMNNTNP